MFRCSAGLFARTLFGLLLGTTCVLTPSVYGAQQAELVFVSGITGATLDGKPVIGPEAQTRQALENLGAALKERGLGYEDVVVSNVFLSDSRHFSAMNTVYRTYFETDPPTRATVQAVDRVCEEKGRPTFYR